MIAESESFRVDSVMMDRDYWPSEVPRPTVPTVHSPYTTRTHGTTPFAGKAKTKMVWQQSVWVLTLAQKWRLVCAWLCAASREREKERIRWISPTHTLAHFVRQTDYIATVWRNRGVSCRRRNRVVRASERKRENMLALFGQKTDIAIARRRYLYIDWGNERVMQCKSTIAQRINQQQKREQKQKREGDSSDWIAESRWKIQGQREREGGKVESERTQRNKVGKVDYSQVDTHYGIGN